MTTVVVTRAVSERMRGFLASSMLEVAAGVYVAPRMSPRVRDTVWSVVQEWFPYEDGASVVMIWREPSTPGELAVRVLGVPPVDFVECDGLVLARRERGMNDENEA